MDLAFKHGFNLLYPYSGTALWCSVLDAGWFANVRYVFNRLMSKEKNRDFEAIDRCIRLAIKVCLPRLAGYYDMVDAHCSVEHHRQTATLQRTAKGKSSTFIQPAEQPLLPHNPELAKVVESKSEAGRREMDNAMRGTSSAQVPSTSRPQ